MTTPPRGRSAQRTVESAIRLALINALSDAADVISADLAPGSVVVRMSGSDPEFDVALPSASTGTEPTLLLPERETRDPDGADLDDEPLPGSVCACQHRSRPASTRWPTVSRSPPTRGCCAP